MARIKSGTSDDSSIDGGIGTGSESGSDGFVNAGNDASGVDNATTSAAGNFGSETGSATDPYTAPAGDGSAETAPIKRTRKRPEGAAGRRTAKTSPSVALNKDARKLLARKVVGIHALADVFTGMNRFDGGVFAITDEQGEQLTGAAMDVMEQYDLVLSPKMAAWGNLISVAALIYYPKFKLMGAVRRAMSEQARPAVNPMDAVTDDKAGSAEGKATMVFA